jgi:hypothetical protein
MHNEITNFVVSLVIDQNVININDDNKCLTHKETRIVLRCFETLFDDACCKIFKKIAGGLPQVIERLFEFPDFISISSVKTSWLVHVDHFCKLPMDESSYDIALH